MALYPLAPPISRARLARVVAAMRRRNFPSSSDTASIPVSACLIDLRSRSSSGVTRGTGGWH